MNRYILTVVAWSMLMSIAIGQTIIDYRGLEIQSPDPTGAAGLRLQNNFKELADRIGPSNLTATTAPTTDDDVDDGYYAGSLWYDTVGGVLYWCADNTDGAAVWLDLSTAGGAAAISDLAYATSWDGVTTVAPSKNALYDYLSGLSSVYQAADADLTTWAGVTSSANGRSLVSAADYSAMKTLLAYGTMADQNANNVAITGGTINGTTIGGTTPGAGTFSSLSLGDAAKLQMGNSGADDSYIDYTGSLLEMYAVGGVKTLHDFTVANSTTSDSMLIVKSKAFASSRVLFIQSASQFGVYLDAANTLFILNGYGADIDTQIKGKDDDNLVFANAGTDMVGIGENAPDYKLDVNGTFGFTPNTDSIPIDNGDVTIDFPTATTLRLRGKSGGTVRNLTLPITDAALTDGQVLKVSSGTPTWAADTDTTYSAGDGLDLTGTDFDLDLKTGGGLEIDTGQLTVTAPLLIGEIGLSWHGTAAEVIDDAVVCPYSGTITSVIITANASGSIELDVWKSASGVPTVTDTICNASYPALSGAQQNKAISVAGWSSTAITAGDTIKFEVRSVSTITQATVQLVIAK